MKYNTIAVAYIVGVIVIAQAIAPGSYNWRSNTISELAAQRYDRAWIMRVGFIGFGVLVAVSALQRFRAQRSTGYRDLPLLLYGAAISLAGIFSARSWVDAVAYAPAEANLHSFMAMLGGVALSLAMFLYWLRDPWSGAGIWNGVAVVLTVALSAAFGMTTHGAGVVQRVLYLVGFLWLVSIERPSITGLYSRSSR